MDLRKRVVRACDKGRMTREQIAATFEVSTAWIRRLLQRRREAGSIAALPSRAGRKPRLSDVHLRRLQRIVQRYPDATLAELRQRLSVDCSLSIVHRAVVKLGLTLKKSRSGPASRIAPT